MEEYMNNVGEYLVRIAEKTREILEDGCFVDVRAVYSCGVTQPGILVVPPKGQACMWTVVGINDMAEHGWDITDTDGCAEELVKMFAENKRLLEAHGFMEERVVWEKVEKLIYPYLSHQGEKGELFLETVYKWVLDFAVAYMIRFRPDEESPWVFVKITESMFNLWNISRGKLHDMAMKNLRREGFAVAEYEKLMDRTCVINPEDAAPKGELETGKMYVLTNVPMYYGAAAILDMRLLGMLSGGGKLYILPANVHSVMVVKDDERIQERYCNEVVHVWSITDDEGDVRFTDHAYCYDGRKNKLRKCFG